MSEFAVYLRQLRADRGLCVRELATLAHYRPRHLVERAASASARSARSGSGDWLMTRFAPSVRTAPGATAFARIPTGPYSTAMLRVSASMPPFAGS
jgi:hypothetical protein